MVKKMPIRTKNVWTPPAKSWSQALRVGNHLHIAGQIPVNAKGKLVGRGDIDAQVRQDFKNIQYLVEAAGGTMDDIISTTIYVTDSRFVENVRTIRKEIFRGVFPTATMLVVAGLAHPDFLVEIEAVAVLEG